MQQIKEIHWNDSSLRVLFKKLGITDYPLEKNIDGYTQFSFKSSFKEIDLNQLCELAVQINAFETKIFFKDSIIILKVTNSD